MFGRHTGDDRGTSDPTSPIWMPSTRDTGAAEDNYPTSGMRLGNRTSRNGARHAVWGLQSVLQYLIIEANACADNNPPVLSGEPNV